MCCDFIDWFDDEDDGDVVVVVVIVDVFEGIGVGIDFDRVGVNDGIVLLFFIWFKKVRSKFKNISIVRYFDIIYFYN